MRAHRVLLTAALLAGLTAVGWAQSWGFSTVANISATLGVNDGRVCVGEGSRQDIGCPTYAPSVNNAGLLTATSLATGGLTVTGATSLSTVSATIGAFNSLTVGGVPITGSASGDRITSGTTTLVAVSNTSFVSLTQSGTNTAWFDPIRGLVTLGVSATGGISGTTGYFSSNVGIGTTAPGSELEVRDIGANNDVRINLRANTSQLFQIGRSSTQSFLDTISSTLNFYTDGTSTPGFVFTNTNRFGLGTLTPAASLTVVGEAQVGSSGAACVAGLAGAIRYNGGALQFCNGTTWTTLGSAGAADWYGLSNIPAQVQNVSNATTLAMNLVSTTNLSATLIQTARISSTNVSGSVGDFTTLRVNGVAVSVGGGSVSPTTPGGASGQVQFNNAGAFDASANLTWTNASSLLTITGTLSATNVYGLNISGTTGFFPNATITALSAGAIAANSLSSTLVSASNVSATRISGSIADFTTLRVNGVNITGSGGTPAGVSGSIQFNSNGTFAGRNNLVVDSNGQVGIGTGTPNASLTVIGRVSATTVQVARDSTACGSGDLGALRLDPSTGRLQVCRQ